MSETKEYANAEKDFLAGYDINQYERPSIAADVAVFSIGRKLTSDAEYRKLPPKTLRLLMIRRAEQPFCGEWALPAVLCRRGRQYRRRQNAS